MKLDVEGLSTRTIFAENLRGMKALFLEGHRYHLVYMDPPFGTGAVWKLEDGTEAFDDRWESREAFVAFVKERARAAWHLMRDFGYLVVHLDPKMAPYVRVALDDLLSPLPDCFLNEIVWRYRRWPVAGRHFQRMHDTLLVYRKLGRLPDEFPCPRSEEERMTEPRWTQLFEPLAASTQAVWKGKKQRAKMLGGRRVRSETGEEASPGVPMSDVWEIALPAPSSDERTGYPTQKPEALLERILLALTTEGDDVLDPFMGSGTTLVVAKRLGRRSVGIDKSPAAVSVARRRLKHDAFDSGPSSYTRIEVPGGSVGTDTRQISGARLLDLPLPTELVTPEAIRKALGARTTADGQAEWDAATDLSAGERAVLEDVCSDGPAILPDDLARRLIRKGVVEQLSGNLYKLTGLGRAAMGLPMEDS